MRKMNGFLIVVMAALLVGQPMLVMGASSARLIPTGNVSVLADGKPGTQFRSEVPLPEGLLLASNGNCLVQTHGLQLVVHDKAVFSLTEGESRWDLTVKNGRVDFAMRPEAKPMAFYTPHDLIQTEQATAPAGTSGVVRGFVTVTEQGTELTLQEGSLQVASSQGSQVVEAGQSLALAKAAGAAGATAAAATAAQAGAAGGAGGLSSASIAAGAAVLGGVGMAAGFSVGGPANDPLPINKHVSPY